MALHKAPQTTIGDRTLRQRRASSVTTAIVRDTVAAKASAHEGLYQSNESDEPSGEEADTSQQDEPQPKPQPPRHKGSKLRVILQIVIVWTVLESAIYLSELARPLLPQSLTPQIDYSLPNVHNPEDTSFQTALESLAEPAGLHITARIAAIQGNLTKALSQCHKLHQSLDATHKHEAHVRTVFLHFPRHWKSDDPIEAYNAAHGNVARALVKYAHRVSTVAQQEEESTAETNDELDRLLMFRMPPPDASPPVDWDGRVVGHQETQTLNAIRTHVKSTYSAIEATELEGSQLLSLEGQHVMRQVHELHAKAVKIEDMVLESCEPRFGRLSRDLYHHFTKALGKPTAPRRQSSLHQARKLVNRTASTASITRDVAAQMANVEQDLSLLSKIIAAHPDGKEFFNFKHSDEEKKAVIGAYWGKMEASAARLKEEVAAWNLFYEQRNVRS